MKSRPHERIREIDRPHIILLVQTINFRSREKERERDCLDEFSSGIKEGDETGRKRVLFLRFLARTTSVRGAILWHIYLERLNFSPLLFSLRDINRGFDGFGLVNTEEYGTDE